MWWQLLALTGASAGGPAAVLVQGPHGQQQSPHELAKAAVEGEPHALAKAEVSKASVAVRRVGEDTNSSAANAELLANSKAQSDMLRSLLLANSQMMYAINTLEKEMMKMREALSSHEAKLQHCERELAETVSAQQQADADRVTLDEPSLDSESFELPLAGSSFAQVAAQGRKAGEEAHHVLLQLGAETTEQ